MRLNKSNLKRRLRHSEYTKLFKKQEIEELEFRKITDEIYLAFQHNNGVYIDEINLRLKTLGSDIVLSLKKLDEKTGNNIFEEKPLNKYFDKSGTRR